MNARHVYTRSKSFEFIRLEAHPTQPNERAIAAGTYEACRAAQRLMEQRDAPKGPP